MKKAKKFLSIIAISMLVMCFAFILTACYETIDCSVNILIKNGESVQSFKLSILGFDETSTIYDLFTSDKIKDVIKADMANKDDETTYLNGIYGIIANPDNYEFIAIYTTIASLTDDTESNVHINDTEFYYANVGIKALTLKNGASYLFSLECLTAQEILQKGQTIAKTELDAYKKLEANDITQFNFEAATKTFNKIYDGFIKSIDNATDTAAIQEIVNNAKQTMDNIIVTIYCTFTDDGEFLFTLNGDTVSNMKIDVPYFDLAEFGYERFYRYKADSFENGGSYIGDTVLLQPTLFHAFLFMNYTMSPWLKDGFSVSGSSCSLYMTSFWGMDENLNYYVDYKFPQMAKGWGSTCDYILLNDDMHIDLAHWSDWNFWMEGVKFIFSEKDTYEINAGETITFDLQYWASDMMNPDPVITDIDKTWVAGTVYTENDESLAIKDGVIDIKSDGNSELQYTFTKAGTYYIVFRDYGLIANKTIEKFIGTYVVEVIVK